MPNNSRGFTLIEILIVVAIIGILTSLLLPNIIAAMEKTKQKNSMNDIIFIATGCADYITDHGSWQAIQQDGPLTPQNAFIKAVYPYHLKNIPLYDTWGNSYYAYVGKVAVENSVSGIPAADLGEDDFLILSHGRDKQSGPVYTSFNAQNPESGLYTVTTMADFNEDLVNWNGSWIIAPRVSK